MTNANVPHLWEVDHPFYGSSDGGTAFESFAELRATVDGLDDGMNHVYRWDWLDWPNSEYGDENSVEEFAVFLVLPRKDRLISFTCPISKDQEQEVLDWLRGPRVLGCLRTLWEPLLDEPNTTDKEGSR